MSATLRPAATRVDGDVGPPDPLVRAEGDLVVTGSVRAGGRISAGGVEIAGDAEAAAINARAGVRVGGDLLGRGAGRCSAAGPVACRSAADQTIIAGGDITADGDLVNVRTCCGRAVRVGGAIRGGKVTANAGIHCRVAGDASGTPTALVAGVDLYVQAAGALKQAELERLGAEVAAIRTRAQPLMEKMRTLSAGEREQVTELLYEADQMERSHQQAKAALDETLAASRRATDSRIEITETLHAGVTLRLGNHMATTSQAMDGPVRIEPTVRNGQPALWLVGPDSGRSVLLPARVVDDAAK